MHDRCVLKVLVDVGYANDRKVCIRKKRVCDDALACRRVGSKRVKALSPSNNIFYDNIISYRQTVLLQRRTCVLNSYI